MSLFFAGNRSKLLAVWNVNERASLSRNAFAETARLFPGHVNDDNSGEVNDMDNQGLFDEFTVLLL